MTKKRLIALILATAVLGASLIIGYLCWTKKSDNDLLVGLTICQDIKPTDVTLFADDIPLPFVLTRPLPARMNVHNHCYPFTGIARDAFKNGSPVILRVVISGNDVGAIEADPAKPHVLSIFYTCGGPAELFYGDGPSQRPSSITLYDNNGKPHRLSLRER